MGSNRVYWTDEEVTLLEEYYPVSDHEEMQKLLPRFTTRQINKKAAHLGLKKEGSAKWTPEAEELLKEFYEHASPKELEELLPQFTLKQINGKAFHMGLKKKWNSRKAEWSKEEIQLLKEHYPSKHVADVKKLLPEYTEAQIVHKAKKLGLKKDNGWTKASWNEEQTELLKKFYPIRTANEMREILPMFTREQMYRKAKSLGLKKRPEVAHHSRIQNSVIARQDLWTDEEKKILIEHYPLGGISKIRELLPHRSEESIKQTAQRIGVTRVTRQPIWEMTSLKVKETSKSFTVTYKRR